MEEKHANRYIYKLHTLSYLLAAIDESWIGNVVQ